MTYWITKDGHRIKISVMPTLRLLSEIHFEERIRAEILVELSTHEEGFGRMSRADVQEDLDFYANWPDEYPELVAEAQKRGLIARGSAPSAAKGLTRRQR